MPLSSDSGIFSFPSLALRSTAWRTKLIAGTLRGSCMVNIMRGFLGSSSVKPSASRISGTTMENGLQSGPTTSTVSPARNLLRRLSVAMPFASQLSTTATTCQSRM